MTALTARIALKTSLVSLLAGALAGCFGVADPMPSPEKPDGSRVLVSASEPLEKDGGPVDSVGVIGLAKAAPKAGFILLHQVATNTVTRVRSAPDGTFAAVLAANAGDRILLTYQESEDGPESDPVDLSIVAYDAAAAPPTPDTHPGAATTQDGSLRASSPEATAPDGAGRIHLTGFRLTPGDIAAIGNVRTGEVLEAAVDKDGNIDVVLAAAPGDSVVVIVRNPATGLTSKVASLTVPAP